MWPTAKDGPPKPHVSTAACTMPAPPVRCVGPARAGVRGPFWWLHGCPQGSCWVERRWTLDLGVRRCGMPAGTPRKPCRRCSSTRAAAPAAAAAAAARPAHCAATAVLCCTKLGPGRVLRTEATLPALLAGRCQLRPGEHSARRLEGDWPGQRQGRLQAFSLFSLRAGAGARRFRRRACGLAFRRRACGLALALHRRACGLAWRSRRGALHVQPLCGGSSRLHCAGRGCLPCRFPRGCRRRRRTRLSRAGWLLR
jgi:hypothetical protein